MPITGADFRGQGPNAGNGNVLADSFQTTLGVSTPKTAVNTTITYDPPSLTTGAFAYSSGITVLGVLLGDNIDLYPPYDTQGIAFQASVSAADTIKISSHNRTAGTLDLASGTWGVVAKRRT